MRNIIPALFAIILAPLVSSSGEQSRAECAQYAKYSAPTMDSSIFIVRKTFGFGVSNLCSGILVSNQFFLTSGECGDNLIVYQSHVILYRGRYEIITDVYPFDSENLNDIANSIALFKLKNPIDLSRHRPACLWTNEKIPQWHLLVQHHWNSLSIPEDPVERNKAFKFAPVAVLSTDYCKQLFSLAETNFCLYSTKLAYDYTPNPGGPILYYDHTTNLVYVTGVLLKKYVYVNNTSVIKAVQLNAKHIEWIESIVWSQYRTSHLTCGKVRITHQPFITYGAATFHGQFPWHVAINRREGVGLKRYICGGTILNQNMILTAAHCVSSELGITSADILTVEVGKYDLNLQSPDSYEIPVDAVIPHEHFRRDIIENDIAILKLKTAIEYTDFIQPICITNDTKIFETNLGVVPGWGRSELNNPSHLLAQATLPIRTNYECRESNRYFFTNFLNDQNFCAGYQNGTNVCTGDSGGGMVIQTSGRWYIKGIVSLGVSIPHTNRCDPTELVLFTDVVKFYRWILSNI